jgi:hypothetical protein
MYLVRRVPGGERRWSILQDASSKQPTMLSPVEVARKAGSGRTHSYLWDTALRWYSRGNYLNPAVTCQDRHDPWAVYDAT